MRLKGFGQMPKKTGFTKLPHGFHKRIVDFKDGKSYTRLAVWLAHRCREGKDGTSYPGLRLIEEELDLKEDTVVQARRWLQDNGWLTKTGTVPSRDGQYAVPVMTTSIPSPLKGDGSRTPSKGTDRTRSTDDTVPFERVWDGTLSTGTEVVPSCEVVPTCEVAPGEVGLPASLCFPPGEGIPPSGLDKGIEEIDNILNEGATVWSLEAVIVPDIYRLFDIHASPDELRFISGTVGEDYDLWQIVLKMAGSKSWSKLITKPENLVFRMDINPKTGKSAFMAECRAALEGRQRHRQQQAVEAKEAGARRFVVDDCERQPKFKGKRIA